MGLRAAQTGYRDISRNRLSGTHGKHGGLQRRFYAQCWRSIRRDANSSAHFDLLAAAIGIFTASTVDARQHFIAVDIIAAQHTGVPSATSGLSRPKSINSAVLIRTSEQSSASDGDSRLTEVVAQAWRLRSRAFRITNDAHSAWQRQPIRDANGCPL